METPALQSAFENTALPANGETFETLREALERTPLGRWFLKEHECRLRKAGFEEIAGQIRTLHDYIERNRAQGRLEILERELKTMGTVIAQARKDIADIRPEAPSSDRIMAATEELDAIVVATERATSDILGAAETIQDTISALRAAGTDPQLLGKMEAEITTIFTACSFQDITGQRTTKVVNVLRYLEQRVNSMIEIWGVTDPGGPLPGESDDGLLNGPAREGEGVSQDDIDELLSGAAAPQDSQASGEPNDQAAIDALVG